VAPVAARLRELHAKGWTYDHLAKELNDFGLPIRATSIREYFTTPKKRSRQIADKSLQKVTAHNGNIGEP
jgi:hypothetical protein